MNKEPHLVFLSNEDILKHIEHLKTLDMSELEKQGMILDWKKTLNKNEDDSN